MTTTHVMLHGSVITRVYHDEHDHGWQFFSEHAMKMKESMLVALSSIVAVDPSVMEVADLLPGWKAWREGPGAPWMRELQYADAAEVIVDWSKIMSEADFYDVVLPQCGSPHWHGRNLDALADSWITGGVDPNGPPYAFGFFAMEGTRPELIPFRDAVLKIADESIGDNGGRYIAQPEEEDRKQVP